MWVGGQMLTSAKKGKKYISPLPWLDKLTKSLSSFWFTFLDLPKISCNSSLPASVAMRSLGSLTEDKSIGWINALRLRITWKFWCWSTSFPVPELRLLLRLLQPIGCKWCRKRNQIVAWWRDNININSQLSSVFWGQNRVKMGFSLIWMNYRREKGGGKSSFLPITIIFATWFLRLRLGLKGFLWK